MIHTQLDSLIADAMKGHDAIRLNALRQIKTTLTKAAKDGIELTDATEAKLLQKMVKQSEDAISQFKDAHREDLASKELAELAIIKEFAPQEISEEKIVEATKTVCCKLQSEGKTISMALTKTVMEEVRKVYPTAEGKIISSVIRSWS